MNFEQFTTLLNAAPEQQATRLLTASELQQGLYLEALQYMGKKLPANLQEKQQLVFNQAIAAACVDTNFVLSESGTAFPQSVLTLLGGAVQRLNAARQVDDKDAMLAANQELESFLNFLTSVAASIARSSFYMHRRAEEVEAKAIAADGKLLPLDLRTEYAGFAGSVFAEPDAVRDAAEAVVEDLLKLHGSCSKLASAWFQSNRVFNCGGFYQDEAFVNFLSVNEVWLHMQTELNRNITSRVPAKDAAAALTALLRPEPAAEPAKTSKRKAAV